MKPVPATVDVALSTLDQQSPETDKPVGRLRKLINAKVKQYQNPRAADGTTTHVKVEKRDAFVTIDDATDDTDGVSQTPPTGTPQVLFGGGDALRMVVDNRLYTKTTNWVKASNQADGDTVVLPQTLRSAPIYTADSQAEAPDFAVIGDTECTVWREVSTSRSDNEESVLTTSVNTVLDGVRVQVASSDGIIRPAFTLDPEALGTTVYMKARVVAQGGYFWVIQDFQTNLPLRAVQIDVTVLNTLGVAVGSTSIAGANYNESWDVTVLTTSGVVIAMPAAVAGVTFTGMTFNGATVTKTTSTDATIKCRATQCAWMTDDTGTASTGYLVTADDVSGPVGPLTATNLYGYRIVSLAKDHEYPVVLSAANQAVQYLSAIAGYHVPGGNDLVVSYALMDIVGVPEDTTYGAGHVDEVNSQASGQFPDQMNNQVGTFAVPFTGVSTVISNRFGMALASRAFAVGSDYVAIGYYPGVKFGPLSQTTAGAPHSPSRPVDPSNFQPCWYVLPLALPQAIAGRFEYGLATADYDVIAYNVDFGYIAPGVRNRCLTSTAVLSTGAIGIPLGYRAEQNIPSSGVFSGTPQQGQPIGDLPTSSTYQTNNTVGIKRFTIGPDCGQPFVVGQATYFPGLMAGIVEPGEVMITEHGLTAPECPRVKESAVADALSVSGAYYYRVAFENVTKSGRTYRSLPSAAFSYTAVQADNLALEITQHNLAVTNKKAVKTSIYRTGIVIAITDGTQAASTPPTQTAGTPTASLPTVGAYKITDDLHPFYSNPALSTSTFTDWAQAGSQATGELLYTDQGYLPRYPAPALRGGCVWQNRAWAIGYDNALWFSGQIAEGEGEWFNPGQRVVIPTNEAVTAIASLDSFLLIFCERSIWYLPESTLPDNTGTGTIPPAIRLPFEMGGTGFSSVIRQGCLYSSSAGGVWMITRSLDNVWIGQAAQDDLSPDVTSMVIAGNNVLVGNADYVMAYDTNLGAWARWETPAPTTLVGASGGVAVTTSSGLVWQQTPGQYKDQDTVAGFSYYVPLTVGVSPVHIGGVRAWKRTWAIQAQGQTADPCDVAFTLSYGDYNTTTKTYLPATLDVGTLEEEIRPTLQLATSVGFEMVDAENADTVTGQGYSLEVISFYIGKEPTLKQLPKGKRPLT